MILIKIFLHFDYCFWTFIRYAGIPFPPLRGEKVLLDFTTGLFSLWFIKSLAKRTEVPLLIISISNILGDWISAHACSLYCIHQFLPFSLQCRCILVVTRSVCPSFAGWWAAMSNFWSSWRMGRVKSCRLEGGPESEEMRRRHLFLFPRPIRSQIPSNTVAQ